MSELRDWARAMSPDPRDFLEWIKLLAAVVLGGLIGYHFGIHEASERFYDNCKGGSVTMDTAEVVGCAELARHIR